MSEPMKLFKSFRGRLMVLMTAFLLLTVVLVLGLDRWAQKRVSVDVRNQNDRVKEIVGASLGAFAESLSTALQNLNTEEYLYNQIAPGGLPPDIKHIVVAEKDGTIADSTDRDLVHKRIPVPKSAVAQNQLGDPVGDESEFSGEQINTYYLPITTAKGLYWIVIVEQRQAVIDQIQDSSQRLARQTRNLSQVRIAATTGLLSVALAVAVIVGWRFTQPIGELAEAARKVAAGQLDFHVGATRRDELGQLSFTFNEMIDGLKAKREIEERLYQTERAAVSAHKPKSNQSGSALFRAIRQRLCAETSADYSLRSPISWLMRCRRCKVAAHSRRCCDGEIALSKSGSATPGLE